LYVRSVSVCISYLSETHGCRLAAKFFSLEGLSDLDNDRQYSPYVVDEPCDEESLHMALCARRQASEGLALEAATGHAVLGELFSSEDGEKEDLRPEERKGWGISAVFLRGLPILAGVI